MRSFIVIEVEHGDTTDALDYAVPDALYALKSSRHTDRGLSVVDYTVAVDLPPFMTSVSVNSTLNVGRLNI